MELPPSDRFRDVFRQRVWTLDRMAVIHLQSAYRSFLYTLLRSSLNTSLLSFLDPFFTSVTSIRIVFSVHLIVFSISRCGLQGFPLFVDFLLWLYRGRIASILYGDYHRPSQGRLLSAFSGGVRPPTAGVNYLP